MFPKHHLLAAFLGLAFPPLTLAQSFAGGDLSSSPGPYGIPAHQLFEAAQVPNSYLAVPINGYNTSIPAGSTIGTGSTLAGWTLAIGVSANVPLASASDDGVDKKGFMEVTALSLQAPADLDTPDYKTKDWRVCAVVFVGGLVGGKNGTGNGKKGDGGCGGWLPEKCIGELQVMSVAVPGNGTGGHGGSGSQGPGGSQGGSQGGCVGMEVPGPCKGYLQEEGVGYGEVLSVLCLVCVVAIVG